METLKVQRLTQGPAASKTVPGRKRRQTTNGLYSEYHGILRRKRQRGLELQANASHVGGGADTGRVWIVPEEEQHEQKFRGRSGQNTSREGSADLRGGQECMLGGERGQFDYGEPKRLGLSVGL